MRSMYELGRLAKIIIILALLAISQLSYAEEGLISVKPNFKKHATESKQMKAPIMVMFSSIFCDYCKFIKEEFLEPMLKSGDYAGKVVITVVEDDIADEIIDFSGLVLDSGKFSDRYNINFTPTIIFMNYKGEEIGSRIIGLGNPAYFGGDLDNEIANTFMITSNYRETE